MYSLRGAPHRDGEQYELFSRKEMGYVEVPWGGRSPRALTKVALSLYSRPEPTDVSLQVPQVQYELFAAEKASRVSRGAPLLVPLPRRP